jgi:hypothetical protein
MTDRAITNQQQAKRAKQREKADRERERTDLLTVVSTVQGRRFVWKLLVESAVFQQSFVPGQQDLTAFNEGRRRMGLGLMLDLAAIDVTLYHRMAKEAQHMDEADQAEMKETTDTGEHAATEEMNDATD